MSNIDQSDRVYTIAEAAARLRVCRATIYNEARDGRLIIKKLRRRSVVTNLSEYIAGLPEADMALA